MLVLLLLLISMNVFAEDSVIVGGVTHHWNWSNYNSKSFHNKMNNDGLIRNPMIGAQFDNMAYFGGQNSIGELMIGSFYQHKLNKNFSLLGGAYGQDRLKREEKIPKIKGAIETSKLDIIPLVGLNTELMVTKNIGANFVITPAVNVLYLKYHF